MGLKPRTVTRSAYTPGEGSPIVWSPACRVNQTLTSNSAPSLSTRLNITYLYVDKSEITLYTRDNHVARPRAKNFHAFDRVSNLHCTLFGGQEEPHVLISVCKNDTC
jgi:hypothetical protein